MRISMATLWLTGVGLALVLAGAGCGGGGGTVAAEPTEPKPSAGAGCKSRVGDGKQIRFGQDGYLAGVLLGSGTTGVVLGHQDASNVCEWLPYGQELAKKGYRVLAFDFSEEGASGMLPPVVDIQADAVAAATYLKSQGVTKLVLMGASKGGTAMLAAIPELGGAVAGVVTFSSPSKFGSADASGVPKTLTVPALYIAGRSDSAGLFATAAEDFAAATPKGLGQLVLVDSLLHGVPLLMNSGPGHEDIVAALDAFLARAAPV